MISIMFDICDVKLGFFEFGEGNMDVLEFIEIGLIGWFEILGKEEGDCFFEVIYLKGNGGEGVIVLFMFFVKG